MLGYMNYRVRMWGQRDPAPPKLQLLERWESGHQPNKDARLREGSCGNTAIQPAAITKPGCKVQPVHYRTKTHSSLGKNGSDDEAIHDDPFSDSDSCSQGGDCFCWDSILVGSLNGFKIQQHPW